MFWLVEVVLFSTNQTSLQDDTGYNHPVGMFWLVEVVLFSTNQTSLQDGTGYNHPVGMFGW
jgi:hypothetical protein